MSYTIKLFGRYFAVGWDKGEYLSLYTYRARGEEQDDWYGFLGLTWSTLPSQRKDGKVGLHWER